MRSIFALVALLATSSLALAENPYAAASIDDPALVMSFVARLKQAVAHDDRAAVAAMVRYPLATGSPGRTLRIYRSAAALRASYATVFTPKVKAAIAAADPRSLFARDQGVMIGLGEIWMTEVHGAMKIITVNAVR